MDRKEVTLLGFEIVAYAGDARSKLLMALDAAEKGDFKQAESVMKDAEECITMAHKAQADLLAREAAEEQIAYSVTMMHGQDHLMTTLLLRDLMQHLIGLYRRGECNHE